MSDFVDYNEATDGFAQSWQSLRFILTPLSGPNANKALTLAGVRKLSGSGYARAGVALVFDATWKIVRSSGSDRPVTRRVFRWRCRSTRTRRPN